MATTPRPSTPSPVGTTDSSPGSRRHRPARSAVPGSVWSDPIRFSLVALVVAAALSVWLFTSAFTGWFQCDYLIVERVSAPQFMCDGADLGASTGVTGAVDSVANALGLGGDDESVVGDSLTVPGLSGLINGPLDVVRRIGIVMTLLLAAATSAAATWVIGNLARLIRLLRFDRREWRRVAGTARVFLSLYIVLVLPLVIVALLV